MGNLLLIYLIYPEKYAVKIHAEICEVCPPKINPNENALNLYSKTRCNR